VVGEEVVMTESTNQELHPPKQHAPSGADADAEKTVAPAGSGATSADDVDSELEAARTAGEYAEAVSGVDADAAAPIPADATEQLSTPGTGSSAPADSTPNPLTPDDLSRG
jgi:hypothetical protein